MLVPCSACYLNLKKVEETIRREPGVLVKLNAVLETENLKLSGRIRVRHLLDVLSRDIDVNRIRSLATKPLSMLTHCTVLWVSVPSPLPGI